MSAVLLTQKNIQSLTDIVLEEIRNKSGIIIDPYTEKFKDTFSSIAHSIVEAETKRGTSIRKINLVIVSEASKYIIANRENFEKTMASKPILRNTIETTEILLKNFGEYQIPEDKQNIKSINLEIYGTFKDFNITNENNKIFITEVLKEGKELLSEEKEITILPGKYTTDNLISYIEHQINKVCSFVYNVLYIKECDIFVITTVILNLPQNITPSIIHLLKSETPKKFTISKKSTLSYISMGIRTQEDETPKETYYSDITPGISSGIISVNTMVSISQKSQHPTDQGEYKEVFSKIFVMKNSTFFSENYIIKDCEENIKKTQKIKFESDNPFACKSIFGLLKIYYIKD
jgi:hypothetical protein